MPVKVIIFGVFITAAVGYAVYEHRDEVKEFADRSRAKIASLLRRIADEISSDEHRQRAEEVPMIGRPFSLSKEGSELTEKRRDSNPFDGKHAEQVPVVSGRDFAAAAQPGLRHRSGGEQPSDVQSTVLSEYRHSPAEIPVAATAATAATAAVVVAATVAAAANDVSSESGYDTAHQPTGRFTPSDSSRTISVIGSDAGASNPSNPTNASNPFENSQPFWSIHEWQENTVQAAPSEAGVEEIPSSPSLAGSAAEELDNISDMASEFGSVASWTEVASEFSDDHLA